MSSPFRQFLTVAAYEMVDAFRSRRAVILLVLYLMGSAASCAIFIHVLQKVEVKVVERLGLPEPKDAGSATETLWKSKFFNNLMTGLLDDNKELVDHILKVPPIALFYSWVSLSFVPLLVVMLSASRISEEVYSSSVRFVLFRCSRATWCLGKWAGQSVLLLGAILLSGLGAWLIAWIRMTYFDPGSGAWHIFLFAVKTWVLGFTYLGLALGVSQWIRSPVIATGVGLFFMMLFVILGWVSDGMLQEERFEAWHWLWNILFQCTPRAYREGLWYPDAAHFVPSIVMLLAMGAIFFVIGFARFSRRDQ